MNDKFQPVEVLCPMDEFENAIRKIGVVAACEWFGYSADSEFTKETLQMFADKAAGITLGSVYSLYKRFSC